MKVSGSRANPSILGEWSANKKLGIWADNFRIARQPSAGLEAAIAVKCKVSSVDLNPVVFHIVAAATQVLRELAVRLLLGGARSKSKD